MIYASSVDARSVIVQNALGDVGKDVREQVEQTSRVQPDKKPANWSGPFALAVLIDSGLCEWKWRPNLGFTYKLDRIDVENVVPGDVAYFDRAPKDEEVIEAEQDEEGGELKSVRSHGRATSRRPLTKEGPHYAIVVDALPTGALRVIKGDHAHAVAVITVSREAVNACYSIAKLVEQFDPKPEDEPEEIGEERDRAVERAENANADEWDDGEQTEPRDKIPTEPELPDVKTDAEELEPQFIGRGTGTPEE